MPVNTKKPPLITPVPSCGFSSNLTTLPPDNTSSPNLEQIAENARALVKKEYTFEVAVKAYEDILASLK